MVVHGVRAADGDRTACSLTYALSHTPRDARNGMAGATLTHQLTTTRMNSLYTLGVRQSSSIQADLERLRGGDTSASLLGLSHP
jgi:hypothetical protein